MHQLLALQPALPLKLLLEQPLESQVQQSVLLVD
jgi:hypothetical protein